MSKQKKLVEMKKELNKQKYFIGDRIDFRRPGCPSTNYYIGSDGKCYSFESHRYWGICTAVPFHCKNAYQKLQSKIDLPIQLEIGREIPY